MLFVLLFYLVVKLNGYLGWVLCDKLIDIEGLKFRCFVCVFMCFFVSLVF